MRYRPDARSISVGSMADPRTQVSIRFSRYQTRSNSFSYIIRCARSVSLAGSTGFSWVQLVSPTVQEGSNGFA
jgi:hypothetical protein